jgi:DNA-binding transcriptional LysR family regulator
MLNIAQPALSANICKLEKLLDVRLFDRVGRQIVLNESGRILLEHVEIMLANWDTACNKLEQRQRENQQQVKIASTGIVFSQSLIRDFKIDHSEIVIKQSNMMVDEIEASLIHQSSDFVLSSVTVNNDDLEAYTLKSEPLYLLMNKKHRLASWNSVSIEDIKNENFIALPEGYAYRKIIDEWFKNAGYKQNVVFECFPHEYGALVGQGIGVTFICERSVISDWYPPEVRWVPIAPALVRNIYILRKKARPFSKACDSFYRYAIGYNM